MQALDDNALLTHAAIPAAHRPVAPTKSGLAAELPDPQGLSDPIELRSPPAGKALFGNKVFENHSF
jgi:hypothetical protein